jgi:hypothetical protein
VTTFIAGSSDDAEMPESLAVDRHGNVFGGFIEMQTLRKYVKQQKTD